MNKIEFLILSSTIDFSTDFICMELEKRGKLYLRLNRDRFNEYKIVFDLNKEQLIIKVLDEWFCVDGTSLRAVYFRAPVFIRAYGKHYNLNEQLYQSQWNAFIRNLIVFTKAKWVNHPVSTYRAENKLLQLKYAREAGLLIPETYIGNSMPLDFVKESYVVKALDTPLFYDGSDELFTYSSVLPSAEMVDEALSMAPVFIQEFISPKIDIRVTIVGDKLFPVQILKDYQGIEGDWRKTKKEDLQYIPCNLPKDIEIKLISLMRKLDLFFGGVDLIFSLGNYYFVEVNPTGEWGWLLKPTGFKIDAEIVNCLEA